ncbi:hypothetical protein BD309DRAFT_1003394 [Dichomitus squalens]|uniref:Uncharacterized protein n=1 Tax=Dichomitus squalens TaxID=114155 RepID=A0A4Q9NH10_9APHY|nr:hypothetical protein BD309DRAFT_1003394 [Dichomitus squalens]TBU53359.1 hypothetical protein BD310DRAFT_1042457 [Dichomitus squalens]
MVSALRLVKQFRVRELAPVLKAADPQLSTTRPKVRNPFLPFKNPDTGRWAPAKYSLRRQAELVKNARASGTLHLLPPGPKLSHKELPAASQTVSQTVAAPANGDAVVEGEILVTDAQLKGQPWWSGQVEWEGEFKEKEVKGADVGNRLYAGRKRMFKGHKWQRTQQEREREQKMLLKDMKARIERFKTTYRRKTPSPISPARPVSYSKLPF